MVFVPAFATAPKTTIVVGYANVRPMITPCTRPEAATQARNPLKTTPASQQPGSEQQDNGNDRGDAGPQYQPALPRTGVPARAGLVGPEPLLPRLPGRPWAWPFLLIHRHAFPSSPYR